MSESSKSISIEYLFPKLLCLLFIYLKLTHQIGWNWAWVTAPFWGSILLATLLESGKK